MPTEDQKRDEEIERESFVTKMLGQQRTMAAQLVEMADALYEIAKAYEATQLEIDKIRESAYRAGREAAAQREQLLAEVLYRYIDRIRERRAHSTQGQYHPEFYKGMKHAADLIAAGSLDAEIESRAAIRAEIAGGGS